METQCVAYGKGMRDLWKRVAQPFFRLPAIDERHNNRYNRIMSNRDDYEKKLETLKAIPDDRVKAPHHVPVEAYIQEAETLYQWVLEDKDGLTAAGLSWELVEDLPVRIGSLVEAESLWYIQRNTREKAAAAWEQGSRLAYKLKKQLRDVFRYAFRNRPDLLETLRSIVKGRAHAKMIQALNDLSLLGENNRALLEAARFDMSLLDKAAHTSDRMATLLAEADVYRNRLKDVKKTRDRAYTHLKEAVDEICRCGRFVFRHDDKRLSGYRSAHLRDINLKRKRETKAKEESQPPHPEPKYCGKV